MQKICYGILLLLIIPLVSSVNLGGGEIGIDLIPEVPTNYSTLNVNDSLYLGGLPSSSYVPYNNADKNIDFNQKDLLNIRSVTSNSYCNSLGYCWSVEQLADNFTFIENHFAFKNGSNVDTDFDINSEDFKTLGNSFAGIFYFSDRIQNTLGSFTADSSGDVLLNDLDIKGDAKVSSDSGKLYAGASDDISFGFNSTSGIIKQEVGSTPFYFQDSSEYNFDNDVTTTGDITGKNGVFSSTTFPVVDMVRDTGASGTAMWGGAKIERLMTGGTALDDSGISFYFKTPNDNGDSTFAGLFGASLSDVSDGTEVGSIVFKPSWRGLDPTSNVNVDIIATSATNADFRVRNGNAVFGRSGLTVGTTSGVGYALVTIEDATNDILKMKIHTGSDTASSVSGMGFGVHTSSSVRRMKSSIFHERLGSYGQGRLVFAVDANTDNADVATTDRVVEVYHDKMNVMGDLNVTNNFTGNQIYAGAWYHNHTATPLTFTDADTFYNMFLTNATDLNGFYFQGGFGLTSNLTAQVSGRYQIIHSSIGDGQNNHVYVSTIMLNGSMDTIKEECDAHKKMSAGGDVITMNGHCIISITAGDVISLVISDDTGGAGNYYGANINIVRVGD